MTWRSYSCSWQSLYTKNYKAHPINLVTVNGVEVERWLCNPRVSGSIPGTGNLEKLFIWMKIHGLTQNS